MAYQLRYLLFYIIIHDFFFIYFVTKIFFQFEELHQDITSVNWTILSEEMKKSLLIVLIRTRKQFAFTTGVIFKPSHESLKDVSRHEQ